MTTAQHVLILLAGIHSLGFAVFHLCFAQLFRWRETMASAGHANRAILRIENGLLTYFFLAMGTACLLWPEQFATTGLGRACLLYAAGLWCLRLVQQFIYLRVNRPMVHVLTGLFAIGVALFAVPALL